MTRLIHSRRRLPLLFVVGAFAVVLLSSSGKANSDDDNDEEQISISLPVQWTLLLAHLNFSQLSLPGQNETDPDAEGLAGLLHEYLTLPKSMVLSSFNEGSDEWLERSKAIDTLFLDNAGADAQSPVGTALAFSPPTLDALNLANTSILMECASRAFLKTLEDLEDDSGPAASAKSRVIRRRRRATFFEEDDGTLTTGTGMVKEADLRHFVVNQGAMGAMKCDLHDEVLPCDPTNPYRTYSGFCNNVRNPGFGKSVVTFDRMIPAIYNDGVSVPRLNSVSGRPLPSPRAISSTVHVDISHLSSKHTLVLMQYSQFLDHDMTLTPVHKGPDNKILNCKDCDAAKNVHPECWPIPVGDGDEWYPARRQNGRAFCMPFTRSLPGQQRLGPREQINQNTAYIDASQIYGEEVCKADSLRGPGGRLNVSSGGHSHGHGHHKGMPPQIDTLKECKSPSGMCMQCGDPRASEQPALAVFHTLCLRQHNAWADGLKGINPHWNDEKVYQESRRIMGAIHQHISFNELLPRLLGRPMVSAYGLTLQADGYFNGYDPSCSATVYNEFSAAAFRFGHSLIRPFLARMDPRYHGMNPHIQLRDAFFNSDMLFHNSMVDEVVRGLLAEPMEDMDPFMTEEVTQHLFEDKKKSFSGLDLISLNIQRGRDHALQGYNAYRSVCNLKKASTWSDFSVEIPSDVLARLQKVYAHVDDVDLFTGSLVERPVTGGILGPVMTCIIGSQFKKVRNCDRHWYETGDSAIRFTPQQLAEIRKMTLSKLMCDNMDSPSDIQRWAMDAPHNVLNPRTSCHKLAKLNLNAWKDNGQSHHVAPQTQPQAQKQQQQQPHGGSGTSGCKIGRSSVGLGESALQSPCVSCTCTSQGSKCTSLKITSCAKLFQQASRSEIMSDSVCTTQCGFYYGTNPRFNSGKK